MLWSIDGFYTLDFDYERDSDIEFIVESDHKPTNDELTSLSKREGFEFPEEGRSFTWCVSTHEPETIYKL